MTDALRVLRERYRATSGNTVSAFRRLAAQLASAPTSPEVIETLRRELHRVHGSAGSYGFAEASRLAAAFEERAIRWAADPSLDRDRRAAMAEHFAGALEVRLGGAAQPTAPPEATAPAPLEIHYPDALDPAETPQGSASGDHGPAATATPDLIVVEDDPALVDMLRYALESGGFTFRHYATGPEALEALLALDTGGARPVILLDIDLPGLDGLSLHERLRVERPDAYATVFLTGRSGEAEQLRAYRAGAMDYVAKPVNLRILMAKIPTWLDRTRRDG